MKVEITDKEAELKASIATNEQIVEELRTFENGQDDPDMASFDFIQEANKINNDYLEFINVTMVELLKKKDTQEIVRIQSEFDRRKDNWHVKKSLAIEHLKGLLGKIEEP